MLFPSDIWIKIKTYEQEMKVLDIIKHIKYRAFWCYNYGLNHLKSSDSLYKYAIYEYNKEKQIQIFQGIIISYSSLKKLCETLNKETKEWFEAFG